MIHGKLEQKGEICVTVGVDDDKSDDEDQCDSSEIDGKHDGNDYYDLHSTHDINDHNDDDDKIDDCDAIKNHNYDSTPEVDDGIIHKSSWLESDDGHDDNRDDTTKAIYPSTSAINSQTAITDTKNKSKSSINVHDSKPSQEDKNQNMKDKILFYIIKAKKKIGIEKINQIKRKKAMQKVFSPTQQTSRLTSTLKKDMRGNKKIESARHHRLKEKNIFTQIADLIYFLFCFFTSPFSKK